MTIVQFPKILMKNSNLIFNPGFVYVQAVDEHLEMLRPAIRNYGGSVEVVSVDTVKGECQVKYHGPAPIGMGIQAAIKDKFPDIQVVILSAP